jgi:hypothetical protein
MIMKINWLSCIFFMACFLLVAGAGLKAQGSGGALVVATCGTLPGAYAVGATRRLTVNTNGQVCQ